MRFLKVLNFRKFVILFYSSCNICITFTPQLGGPASFVRSNSFEKRKQFQRPSVKTRIDSLSAGKLTVATDRMSSPVQSESTVLLRQNQDLRTRLQEEASNYRRRLDTYKQSQQNQAALVGRLQNKVLQYKQRCSDLEGKIHDVLPYTPRLKVRYYCYFVKTIRLTIQIFLVEFNTSTMH